MKLVRDKYNLIIPKERLFCVTDSNEQNEFYANKIHEELDELIESNYSDIFEYADLIETIYAMATFKGISLESIEHARIQKLNEKGGFDKCLVLIN